MYCPSCGAQQVVPESNFCKQCGKPMNAAMTPVVVQPPALSTGAAIGIGLFTFLTVVSSLGVLIGLLDDMGSRGVAAPALVFLGIAGFITVLGIFFMMCRMWLALTGGGPSKFLNRSREATTFNSNVAPPPLFAPAASNTNPRLDAARPLAAVAPPASVTEHTTRTLEAVPRDSRS